MEVITDPGDGSVVSEVGLQNLKDEGKSVLTVRDDEVGKNRMCVFAGAMYSLYTNAVDRKYTTDKVTGVPIVRTMPCKGGSTSFANSTGFIRFAEMRRNSGLVKRIHLNI